MFVIIITLLTTLMHAYLTWRIGTLEWFSSVQVQRSLWFVSFIIWLTYLVGIRFAIKPSGKLAFLLERISMDWLGVLFIGTIVLLTFDLLTGFGLWAKPWLEVLRISAIAIALLMIVVAFFQGTRPPVINHYEVNLPHLPAALDGSRVVMLSDLHLGSQFGPHWLAKRVVQVEALKPDLIFLVGDIFEGHGPPDPGLQPLFERLHAPLGTYAVTGNHEFYGNTKPAIAMSEKAGVVWLHNQTQEIAPGLLLAGVEDLSVQRMRGETRDSVSPLLTGSQKGAVILLSHSPLQVEQAATAGTGLMLSGHTHNGQIWPFNYLVRKFFPYITGRYTIDRMTLIVGRGTGLWGPRMRLWQPGEIIEVTLHPQQ
jgi:uncharacterized protein